MYANSIAQLEAAWAAMHFTIENGVEDTGRSWNNAVRGMTLRPTSKARIVRMEPRLLEQAPDGLDESQLDGEFFEALGQDNPTELAEDLAAVHKPPLPLQQVLDNLKHLHRNCGDRHVCGLPPRLQKFDVGLWLDVKRAYGGHAAAGIRNRVAWKNGRPQMH